MLNVRISRTSPTFPGGGPLAAGRRRVSVSTHLTPPPRQYLDLQADKGSLYILI